MKYSHAVKLTKNVIFISFLLIVSLLGHFKIVLLIFKVILLVIFRIFLGHQNPGPTNNTIYYSARWKNTKTK